MSKNNQESRILFKKSDFLLIILFVAVSGIFYFVAQKKQSGKPLKYILHTPSGKVEIVGPNLPRKKTVEGKLGKLLFEWDSAGRVRVASSSCPNKICVNCGWTMGNSSIVCVPNQVFIEILADKSEFDGVSR